MAYSLRLPPTLDALARERADYLGISLNSLVCVALDGLLRSPGTPVGAPFVVPPSEAFELVAEEPGKSAAGGKQPVKKASFKDRQRAKDTLFNAVKKMSK